MITCRMTVICRVPDVDRWMAVLRRDVAADRPGLVRRVAYRSIDDPNEMLVDIEFESIEAATSFLPSLDVRDLLDQMGLDLYPPVFLGVEVEELHVDYR
jgi:hypothetical protein